MKKKKYTTEEEVSRTMASLDRLQRVKGDPDLYDKVLARSGQEQVRVVLMYRRWQVAAAILLLAANVFSLQQYLKSTKSSQQESYYEALAEDYSLGMTQEEEVWGW